MSPISLLVYSTHLVDANLVVQIDGPVLEDKSSFKILGISLSSKFDWARAFCLLFKLPSKQLFP